MVGIGTLIDVSLTLTGGICGILFGRFMTKHLQDSLMKSTAVAVIFIGLAGALSGMLSIVDGKLVSGQTAMIVISLVLGSLVGEHERYRVPGGALRGMAQIQHGQQR